MFMFQIPGTDSCIIVLQRLWDGFLCCILKEKFSCDANCRREMIFELHFKGNDSYGVI